MKEKSAILNKTPCRPLHIKMV